MEIGHLLVRSGKTVVDHEMDFFGVPDLLNAHLTEDLDRQGSSAILGHCHVRGQNSDLSSIVDLLASISFDADDFLSESKRIIVQDRLGQSGHEAGQNCRY